MFMLCNFLAFSQQTNKSWHTPNCTIKHYWNSQNYIWKFIFFHFPLHSLNNQTELIHTTLQLAHFKCKPKETEIRKRDKSSRIKIDSWKRRSKTWESIWQVKNWEYHQVDSTSQTFESEKFARERIEA